MPSLPPLPKQLYLPYLNMSSLPPPPWQFIANILACPRYHHHLKLYYPSMALLQPPPRQSHLTYPSIPSLQSPPHPATCFTPWLNLFSILMGKIRITLQSRFLYACYLSRHNSWRWRDKENVVLGIWSAWRMQILIGWLILSERAETLPQISSE